MVVAMAVVAGRIRALRSARIPAGHEPTIVNNWRRYAATGDATTTSVVVFSDFRCGACKYAHDVLASLPDPLRPVLSVQWRQLPLLGPVSVEAARAVSCLTDRDERERLTATLFALADSLGMIAWMKVASRTSINSPELLQLCIEGKDSLRELIETRRLAADLGVVTTPSVLLDSMLFRGMPSPSYLTSYLRKAHESAKRNR